MSHFITQSLPSQKDGHDFEPINRLAGNQKHVLCVKHVCVLSAPRLMHTVLSMMPSRPLAVMYSTALVLHPAPLCVPPVLVLKLPTPHQDGIYSTLYDIMTMLNNSYTHTKTQH